MMEFYDIGENDKIKIGNQQLIYQRIENSNVIEATQNMQPNPELNIPDTEDLYFSTTENTRDEKEALTDLEFPATPEDATFNEDLFPPKLNIPQSTQMSSGLIKVEEPMELGCSDENKVLETQPFLQVPPSTRSRTKQQNLFKPKTRSLAEFEMTQGNYGNFYLQTQPFKMEVK